jgi:hypothetical protein
MVTGALVVDVNATPPLTVRVAEAVAVEELSLIVGVAMNSGVD